MAASMKKRCRLLQQTLPLVLAAYLLFCVQFRHASCGMEEITAERILSEVEKSCVVVFFAPTGNTFKGEDSSIVDNLQEILTDKREVTFGRSSVLLTESFRWPDDQPLRWVNKPIDSPPVVDHGWKMVAFPRRKQDRKCLIPAPKSAPKAEGFTGAFTMETILDWINGKCHSYIAPSGHLTMEGLHRERILQNLFRMSDVSKFTMRDFAMRLSCAWSSPSSRDPATNGQTGTCETELDSEPMNRISDDPSTESDSGEPAETMAECERLSALPTQERFFREYLTRSKPFIIEGAASRWDAFNKWTMDYLRSRYGNNQVHIKLAPDGLFEGVDDASNWEEFETFSIPPNVLEKLSFPDLVVVRPATMNLKFSEFLDLISRNETNHTKPRVSAYLEYSSIPAYLPELERDIEELPFVRDLLSREHLNIWLSDGNTLGKLHFDEFDNFLCQIRGSKQLILFEPHDNTRMYEAHIPEAKLSYDPLTSKFHRKDLQDSTAMVMAPVDILSPDFQRFPTFSEMRPLNCTINEGDILFMPAFWWHEVQSFPNVTERRNLAVNFWYKPFLTKEFPCPHCKLDVNPVYRYLL